MGGRQSTPEPYYRSQPIPDYRSKPKRRTYNIDKYTPPKNRGYVDKDVWEEHKQEHGTLSTTKGTNKRWNNGVVPYKIASGVNANLKKLINEAIAEFDSKTPIRWVYNYGGKYSNYVKFRQNDDECPKVSDIGQKGGTQYVDLPFPYYPESSSKLSLICVLHEMMHVIGFLHEHSRGDAIKHLCYTEESHYNPNGVAFGQYDYKSIMHYGEGVGLKAKNNELARLADESPTFSQGDLAGIRRVYGKSHFGEWHNACSSSCTSTSCGCGNCGELPGGVNCGYVGSKGHWTCCLNENYNSRCNDSHTGFWHMECVDSECTAEICYCNSCGGGCTYEGYEGHWSCCNSENFYGKCSNSPY